MGTYCYTTREPKKYQGKHILVSKADARRFGSEDLGNGDWVAHERREGIQWSMAMLPLLVLLPKEGSVDWGPQCKDAWWHTTRPQRTACVRSSCQAGQKIAGKTGMTMCLSASNHRRLAGLVRRRDQCFKAPYVIEGGGRC